MVDLCRNLVRSKNWEWAHVRWSDERRDKIIARLHPGTHDGTCRRASFVGYMTVTRPPYLAIEERALV